MRYATQDKFLADAFAVVRKVDPDTYARIKADNTLWTTSPIAMRDRAVRDGLDFGEVTVQTIDAMHSAFGWTLSDRDENPELRVKSPLVFINDQAIKYLAPEKGIDPVKLAASVIVHEFYHVHQADTAEQPAYAAQIAFAHKMGGDQGERIARAQAQTARHVATFQGR